MASPWSAGNSIAMAKRSSVNSIPMNVQFNPLEEDLEDEVPTLQLPLMVFFACSAVCSATVPVASKVNVASTSATGSGVSSSSD